MIKYDFAVGQTNPETFPTEAFKAAAVQAIDQEHEAFNRYPGPKGHEGLRKLMAARESEREGVLVDPELLALTNGSMQAVTLVGQALMDAPGDVVITEEFTYSGTISAYKGIGLDIQGVGMDEQGMRMDLLEQTISRLVDEDRRPRFIYTLTTYQNPTGTCMPLARKQTLIEIARRFDIPVVEDNCYGDVHFDGDLVPTMFALDEDPRHIYIGSLSKIFAPGVRLGYLYAKEPMYTRIVSGRHDAGSNYFAAAVLAQFYKQGIADHNAETLPALKRKRDLLLAGFESCLEDTCVWSRPSGGLFAWLRLPADTDMQKLVHLSEENNLFFATGADFHVSKMEKPYIRLAFGHLPDDIIEAGVVLLAEMIQRSRTSNASRDFDTLF